MNTYTLEFTFHGHMGYITAICENILKASELFEKELKSNKYLEQFKRQSNIHVYENSCKPNSIVSSINIKGKDRYYSSGEKFLDNPMNWE